MSKLDIGPSRIDIGKLAVAYKKDDKGLSLEEFVRGELFWHCRALELYTKAAELVARVDPEACTEELLWELFLQAGPIANVHIPKDKVTNTHQGFGFVEFKTEEDSDYAIKIMQMIKLHGQPLRLNKKASGEVRIAEVGANLFLGNLDPDVDEKLLYDTFSAFGVIVGNTPKCMRDPDTGASKGFAFINYDCFEASDMAIEAMNGQYLKSPQIWI